MNSEKVSDMEWLADEVWKLISEGGPISQRHIALMLVPYNSTIVEQHLRERRPTWTARSIAARADMIDRVIEELVDLGRVKPPGKEKLSYFTPLAEVPVLDSLSQI